jgi:ATP-dependent protease ClpP protease subunit
MNLSYRNERNARAIAAYYNKPIDKPDWYSIKNSADSDEATILIYDALGFPFNDAYGLVREVEGLKDKKIRARINSPGGDLVDAVAIYRAFREHGNVTTVIESMAASSATLLVLGGKERLAYNSSTFMVHEPWVVAAPNIYELDELRDVLGHFSSVLVDIYAEHSTMGKREIKQLMKGSDKADGTFINAKRAKEYGFIDKIIESGKGAKAEFDLSVFANIPNEFKENKELTERDAERILRDAGFSRSKAKAAIAKSKAVEDNSDSTDGKEIEDMKAEVGKLISIFQPK